MECGRGARPWGVAVLDDETVERHLLDLDPSLAPGVRIAREHWRKATKVCLPRGTVVYHGTSGTLCDQIAREGLRPSVPAGDYQLTDRNDEGWRADSQMVRLAGQPCGVYVSDQWEDALEWAREHPVKEPGVWTIDAGHLMALRDPVQRPSGATGWVFRRVHPKRLLRWDTEPPP